LRHDWLRQREQIVQPALLVGRVKHIPQQLPNNEVIHHASNKHFAENHHWDAASLNLHAASMQSQFQAYLSTLFFRRCLATLPSKQLAISVPEMDKK